MKILFYKILIKYSQLKLKWIFQGTIKVHKQRFTGKFMVKRAFTVIIVYSRFTVFYSEKTVKIEVFVVKLHQFNGLIIRGSQDHALVGPQPKGYIIKGLCCQRRRPFLFGVNLCQVCARFCDFRGKTGVNGGERMELNEND